MSNQAEPILDLEALVPTTVTCERLGKAGFPQCVTWIYVDRGRGPDLRLRGSLRGQTFDVSDRVLPAPTAAELGRVLPLKVRYEGVPHFLSLDPRSAYYITEDDRMMLAQKTARTEAEARARLWLHLESEGLLLGDNITK